MNDKIIRRVSIIKNLILTEKKQNDIANDYNISESYVSQISRKIKNLINPPRVENDKLVCFKCGIESDNLEFHHAIGYPGYIAIVCHSCNVRLGQNYLDYNYEGDKDKRPIITWVTEEMAKDLAKIINKYKTNISDLIRRSLEKVIEAEFG